MRGPVTGRRVAGRDTHLAGPRSALRHTATGVRHLALYGLRTGRWWVVVLVPVLAGAAVVAAGAKATAPLLYTLF